MAITRYSASADTTITNAYELDLTTRGTGSNMGAADVVETFMIYNQTTTGSVEKSRILIKFPVGDISTDRTAGNIPASGSVSFYLKMFNVPHALTLPKDFTLSARPITTDWQEGAGLDMETYLDITRDRNKGANWIVAQSGSSGAGIGTAAVLADAIDCQGISQNDAFTMTVPATAGGDATAHQFVFDNTTDINALSDTTGFGISMEVATSYPLMAAALVDAINGTVNSAVQYGGATIAAGSTLTAGTLGLTAAITDGETTKITLTMDDGGTAGNVASVLAANTGFEDALLLEATFTGGTNLAKWTAEGGDYDSDSTYTSYTQTFVSGWEDLNINVTSLVEEWIAGTKSNYGVGVHLTGSIETGSVSYYTKKFFARSSEYYFKRPTLEARWDSTKKDDRGNFYVSSSLVPERDNVNTLYLYNYVRGQLKNIPSVATGHIYVTLHTGSGTPTTPAIELRDSSSAGTSAFHTYATGGYVEAGIYSASVVITGALSGTDEYYYDVWSTGQGGNTLFTGSGFTPKTFGSRNNTNPDMTYYTKITNLKSKYSNEETARFRLYVRPKDWSPTIYTVASKDIENTIIEDAYYKIHRIVDGLTVIDYGTGSTTPQTVPSTGSYTRMSFDVSGNYFDLDMSLLESGYSYGVKFLYFNNGYFHEQSELFKFRVKE